MKILFLMLIIATWVLGTYEGDCTVAVMLSLFGVGEIIQGSRKTDRFFGKRRSRPKNEALSLAAMRIKRTSFDEGKGGYRAPEK